MSHQGVLLWRNKSCSLISKAILIVLLIHSVVLVPAFGAPLAQGSSKEVLEDSLANLRSEIEHRGIYQVVSAPISSGLSYAATEQGLFATQDGGRTWSKLPLPSETTTVFAVATGPADGSLLWAGTREGLWSSQDEGRSWSRVTSDLPPGVVPLSLSIGANSGLLYMGTARHGVLRSQDGDSTWEDISRGLPEGIGRFYGAFSSLALSAADDSVLLVGTELGQIFRSADRGDSWEGAQGIPEPATRRTHTPVVVFARGLPEAVYAIISRPVHSNLTTNTLFKSLDSGQSWFAVKELKDNEKYLELRVEESNPRILIAVSQNSVLPIEDVFAPPEVDSQNYQINSLEPLVLGDRTQQLVLDQDIGEIAVLVDDGELIETFDLDGTTIQFTPNSSSGYDIEFIDFTFDPDLGTDLNLVDDASSQQNLDFTFPFYGMDFSDLFVNSNGNLTFGEGDLESLVSVEEFVSGSKMKIAPLWNDLDPESAGGVFFKTDGVTGEAVITWSEVPEFTTSNSNTFQLRLSSDGVITFSYNGVAAQDGLVGLSNCCQDSSFSLNYTLDLPGATPEALPVLEFFDEGMNITEVARRFYAFHSDNFDQMVVFGASSFTQSLAGKGAVAFHADVSNDTSGIGRSIFDSSSSFGSAGRLQSFINMNRLSQYPDDPNEDFNGADNTLDILGQEVGHRWGAFVSFDDAGMCSTELLGRADAHWSFFLDSDASDLEGNSWVDNLDGSFTTDEASERFSHLDQYLMGVRPDSQVDASFFVDDPSVLGVFDLDGKTLQFTPNTDVGYDVAFIGFSFDSTLGTDLSLGDESFSQQTLGFTFPFFGTDYTELFVTSNGNLTFGTGEVSFLVNVETFVTDPLPRIAGLWDDFDPGTGGAVFFKTDGSSKATITWSGIPEFFLSNSNTFQVTLESSGTITMTYNGIETRGGLVGLSNCCQASVNDSFSVDYSQDLPVSGFTALPIHERWSPSFLPTVSSPPQVGVTVLGTRQDVTIAQVQTCEEVRSPAFGDAPTTFNETFVLLVPKGESATTEDLAKLDEIRLLWELYFSQAIDARGQVTTTLDGTPSVCPWPLGHPNYCTDCGPCGVGLGDCDGDAQCESGLSCVDDVGANYGFAGNVDVCETCPWPLGHPNYCRDCGPCGAGLGDCDGDAQCESGLSCVDDVGANFGFVSNIDVCLDDSLSCSLSPGHADFCSTPGCGPCDSGVGDCDADSDCSGSLICGTDNGLEFGLPSNFDVCVADSPSCTLSPGHADFCSTPGCGPCGVGVGDCDSSNECESGLSCVDDVGANYGFAGNVDVCESG